MIFEIPGWLLDTTPNWYDAENFPPSMALRSVEAFNCENLNIKADLEPDLPSPMAPSPPYDPPPPSPLPLTASGDKTVLMQTSGGGGTPVGCYTSPKCNFQWKILPNSRPPFILALIGWHTTYPAHTHTHTRTLTQFHSSCSGVVPLHPAVHVGLMWRGRR